MTSFSFKKIKFFHSKENTVRKTKNNGSPIENKEALSFWKKLTHNPFFYLIIFSAIIETLYKLKKNYTVFFLRPFNKKSDI